MRELLEMECDLERVAVILNPASGQETAEARREKLKTLAQEAGLTCELAETDADTGAGPLAEEAIRKGAERILVNGGDGSVTEAAEALAGTGRALAVIPGGTGNLLALNIGIPTDTAEAMAIALKGPAVPMDVGRANGRVFTIMAGIGNDARMIRDADRELKNRLGVLAYFVSALKNIGRPLTSYRITLDGRTFRRRAQTIMIANLGRITGGVELVPDADPADGVLDVVILRARGLIDFVRLGVSVLMRRHAEESRVELLQAREIVIECRRSQPVQLDGNEADRTKRLEVHVEPNALLLVRPPAAEAAASPGLFQGQSVSEEKPLVRAA